MAEKYVVKVYQIYPVWGMGQLAGAVVCDDEDRANEIAFEMKQPNINTEVIKVTTDDYENDLWREWAEDIERLTQYYHYKVWGLNIITAAEFREEGLDFVEPDFDNMVYTEDREFLGWYDAEEDAVVDARGKIIGRYDEEGNFIREKEGE
jgi:hypothetical protein